MGRVEMERVLAESLKPCPGVEAELKEDFRKVEVRYVCAGEGREEQCVGFRPGVSGCAFASSGKTCLR
jgi:hypothetical protein